MTRLSKRAGLFLTGVLLLAFALRLHRIGYQSIWGDEAYSIWRSGLPLSEIPWQVAKTGNLAPLYYFLLHFWQMIAGSSETAVRFFSLFFGVLALPLAFKLMERLHSREAGLYAALIGAVSPFWVYYSQETKMYSQMAFTVLLSSYLFLRIFEGEGKKRRLAYIAYGLATAAAVYTHYFAAFVILAHGAYLLASRRLRPGVRPWIASQSLSVVLFLPWAVYAASALAWAGSSVKRGAISLADIAAQVLRAFAVGSSLEGNLLPWALGAGLVLLLVGLVAVSGHTRIFLLMAMVLTIVGVYGISFLAHPGWARYFMAASPAFYGLIAAGLAFLYRRHFAFGLAALVVLIPSGLSLANYYSDPQYARYDYRAQVQGMMASSSPDDGVIVNGPEDFPAFFYYYDGSIPAYVVPPKGAIWDRSDVEGFLNGLHHSGLWLVKYMPPDFDGDNAIENWLRRNTFPLQTKWVENVTFTYFSLPADGTEPRPGEAPATFEKGIRLLGYQAKLVPWGKRSILQIAFLWQADQKVDQPYTVFVQALAGADRKLGQGDSEPVGGLSPTTAWNAGDKIVDRHAVLLPEAFNKEGARLEVGLYDLKTGTRLQVLSDTGKPVGTALVLPFP